ncbi:MAG: UvrD-helicase domain-containing protein [Candidatus Pacearchaeota archaeon]
MKNVKVILGAPGCGKTTYLIRLLEDLLKRYAPNEIAFVSFTKKGSYEGRNRAMDIFSQYSEEDFEYFRTIHSICFKELGLRKFEVIGKKYYKEFSKAMGMHFLGYYTEDLVNNDDKYLFQISLENNNPILAEKYKLLLNIRKYEMVKKGYTRFKEAIGIVDFDDMLLDFLKRGKPLPVKVAIIDEAQDLTTLQWQVCQLAFGECDQVYIAGDDDQAIYEWSGADVKQFLTYAKNNPKHILEKSYRLKSNILEFSKNFTKIIKDRVDKVFDPVDNGGGIYFYNNLSDIVINNEETYYMLSRNNYYLSNYKAFVMRNGLMAYYKQDYLLKKDLYEAIKKYEFLRKNNPSSIAERSGLKMYLKKDIVDYTNIVWYDAFDLTIEENAYYRDIFKNHTDITKCNIHINTIHGVKGGEADNVILVLDMTKAVYTALTKTDSLDSELRVLYVALTRAKKNLHIVFSKSQFGYDEFIKSLGGIAC